MDKLLELSKEIDNTELLPLVDGFVKAAKGNDSLTNVYEQLTLAKQKTKRLDLLVFISALLEAISIFNDFSTVDASVKKEMLQGCRDSTQFYLNRILKESKEKNEPKKQQWAKELEEFLGSCQGGNNKSGSKSEIVAPKQTQHQQQQPNIFKSKTSIFKEPRMELVGNIWYIENQSGNTGIEVNITEMQQRIVIINCADSVVQVKGKCTAVSVEQGKKLGVVVHDVIVSTFELLNSTKTQIQLNSICPIMTIDNSEGIQVFLGAGVSDKFELLTCKSNEINIYRQKAAGEDYSNEIPVPEQFKSFFDESGNLKTIAFQNRHSLEGNNRTMELEECKTRLKSLFDLSQQSLTVSLLKLRSTASIGSKITAFSFPALVERIKFCKGIEVVHLISALPHSGLRPDLLEFLEINHPAMGPFLEKYWKEVCAREFPRLSPEQDESWLEFYHKQLNSTKSKIEAAGSRIRDSYLGEERKVHQLQTISVAHKRARPSATSSPHTGTKRSSSLMEKSRQEALNSSNRTNKSPNKSVVTFRMRQPSKKR